MVKGIKAACKKLLLSALGLLALLSFLHVYTTVPGGDFPLDDWVPFAIQIDGVDYIYYGGAERQDLSDADVELLGEVSQKTAPRNRMPEKDGQANFNAAGCPYGVAPDGEYVFFYEGCWRPLILPQ